MRTANFRNRAMREGVRGVNNDVVVWAGNFVLRELYERAERNKLDYSECLLALVQIDHN